ncbi:MAG: hypothetical protein ABIB79_03650 [archaeon]
MNQEMDIYQCIEEERRHKEENARIKAYYSGLNERDRQLLVEGLRRDNGILVVDSKGRCWNPVKEFSTEEVERCLEAIECAGPRTVEEEFDAFYGTDGYLYTGLYW